MDLTRRQAIGLGAVALGALRVPSRALAADAGPALFELPLGHLSSRGWQTTAVLKAPHRFDLVGLRWARAGHVHAQVRAPTHNGRWTRWTPLPHAHAPLTGTDPAYTGVADELQLRLRGSARRLTLRFVHATPPPPPARAAQAPATGAPGMVPRAGWGAEQVPPRNP